MRRIFALVMPHWRRLLVAALCSSVFSGLNGSLVWLVKPIVDDVFVRAEKTMLFPIAMLVIGIFLLRAVTGFIQNYIMNSVGSKIVRNTRDRLYAHLMRMPIRDFTADSSGAMLSRVINDAGMFQDLLANRIRDLFVSTGTIIILTCIAFYRRWDLTLIAVVVLPFAFYLVSRLGKRLKRVSGMAQKKISTITEKLSEGLRGIKVIKTFSMEEVEAERFRQMNQAYYRDLMRGCRTEEAGSVIMEVVAGFGVALIIVYGGGLVADKVMSAGDFFSFMTAVLMIYTPAKRLANAMNSMSKAEAYIDRIEGLLHKDTEADGEVALDNFSESIEYDNVTFRYDTREENALNALSLKVKKGEVVALVGMSGSGKTTLVDLLPRLYTVGSGMLRIDGRNITDYSLKSLRGNIGIVSQDVMLFNDTVAANIEFGTRGASMDEIVVAAKAAYAHDFIMGLPEGYKTRIGESGVMLSGGQRQRLSIARAVLKNPPILILDEATSALDTQSEMMVQHALDEIISGSHSAKKTIFIIAHRLSTIKMADRIVVMDKGRIAEEGTHDELIARGGLYKTLHSLQHGGVPVVDA